MVWRPTVKPTAPAWRRRPSSVISLPLRPRVRAAIGKTRTAASSRARRAMKSTRATSSMTGAVSGIVTMVVTPPAAAARPADAKVSRCSAPGSPTKTRMSTSPGATMAPRQSTISAPGGRAARAASAPAATMRRSATITAPAASRLRDGSTMRALANTTGRSPPPGLAGLFIGQVRRQRFEHGHADGDAHLDLLADEALGAVGDERVDLDAAVHRAGVHDERIRLGKGELFRVEPEEVEIFPHRGDEAPVHPLALQPQHHHDVGAVESEPHVVEDLDAHPLDAGRDQGRRPDHPHPCAERIEEEDVRAGDAAVRDVAADRDREGRYVALVPPDGQRIEERLRRVLVGAVAGVDDR